MNEEAYKKISENFRKIVEKINALEARLDGFSNDLLLLHNEIGEISKAYNSVLKETRGTQTALIGAGLLTTEGVELHTSFDVPDELKLPRKKEKKKKI